MVSKFPDIAARLAHVIATCGYPTDAAFADAIGRKAQNLRNWRERGSIGRDSLERILAVTGASMDWMATGKGEPFPGGVIPYSGVGLSGPDAMQRLAAAEETIIFLGGYVTQLLRAIGHLAPREAAAVAADIRKNLAKPERAPAVVVQLLVAADAAVPTGAPVAHARPGQKKK